MTRHVPFRQIDVKRAVAGAQRAGIEIGGVEITRDGTIRILTAQAVPSKDDDPIRAQLRELCAEDGLG